MDSASLCWCFWELGFATGLADIDPLVDSKGLVSTLIDAGARNGLIRSSLALASSFALSFFCFRFSRSSSVASGVLIFDDFVLPRGRRAI